MLSRMVVVIAVIYRARSKAEAAGPSGHAGDQIRYEAKQHVPAAHPRLRRRSSGVGRSIIR